MTREGLLAKALEVHCNTAYGSNRVHAVVDLVLREAAAIVRERREKMLCDEDWDLMQAAYERISALLPQEPAA